MKKYFLTMLVGLLPLMGWAAEEPPVVKLASVETEYNGNNTAQPALSTACRMYGDVIIAVKYLGHEGDQAPVTTWDIDDINTWDNYPVRDAGEYIVVVERDGSHSGRVETPRAPMKAEGDGETVVGGDGNDEGDGDDEGDDEGDDDDEIGEIFELTYTVLPLDRPCKLANCDKVYGAEFPEPRYYNDNAWPAGDSKNVFQGGKIVFSDLGFDAVGTQAIWYTGKVYIRKPNGEIDYNYVNPVTGGGTATCDVSPAKLYAHAKDAEKTFGECDEDVEFEFEYLGWVKALGTSALDTYESQVIAGANTETVVRADGQEGEDVGEYGLIVKHDQVELKNYEIVDEPFEFEGEMLPEQGKLTINQKSLNDDDIEVTWTFSNETGEITAENPYIYGQTLNIAVEVVYKNMCTNDGADWTLTPDDYTSCLIVDECDKIEICGQGNFKDCESVTPPTPDPTCLNITAGAEPGEFTLGEEFEINYEITGWQNGEDFSEAVEDVISYEIFDADGEKVEQPIENAGEYTVKFTVGDLPAEPAGLANYKVCDEPEDITITVDPICIEDATITIERTEGADNCFPFTGSKIEPAVTVTLGDKELVKGTDYTVTYGNEEKDNIHPTQGGIITVTGINNYECDVTTEFCIAPGEAKVKVAPVSFDDETIIEGVKYYQNGKFYGQAEPEIILEYEGITAEELKALGLDIKGQRYNGENVGFYSVAIFNGEEQLTTGVLKFNGEDPVETNTLTTVTRDFGDITITFEPGTFEIRRNQTQLEFHAEIEEVYGEIGIDIQKLRADRDGYLAELIEKYFDDFEATGFQGNDNQSKLRNSDNSINTNIVDPWDITFDDIAINGVSITKDGVPNMELFKDVICNPTGYIHAGTYHVDIVGATSPNYNIGTIDMDVTITQRPIKITIEDVELAPREEIDLTAVNWTAEDNKPAPAKRGYAVLDAPLDIDNSILNVVIIVGKTTGKLAVDKTVFNPDYKPEYNYGEITNKPGHFIIHRVAADLQDNPWNDAVAKITAFDGQTVERVYFRTFDLAGTENLFDDLFNDGEEEPVTAEVDGELDAVNGFPMYADKWYAMVLPFDVTVYELAHNFFEYAVINVLDLSNKKENVIAFKLQATGTIKANTPFCVKLGDMGQVNPETGDADLPLVVKNLDQMYFENKTIVKPADFENIYVEDESGVRFYGSYDGKLGFKANEYFFTTKKDVDTYNNYYYGSETNHTWLRPSGSFLYTPEAAGARTIIMQEEDGSFTAIESIENIAKVNTAEGWFTTNGVKLNAQPTQKGVYIHNGKKVVVK